MSKNFFDELPETFREDCVRFIVEDCEYTGISDNVTIDYSIVIECEVNAIMDGLAERHPLEYTRYKKIIGDTIFAIIFSTQDRINPKIINLLEAKLLAEELSKSKVKIRGKELKASKVYQKIVNGHS